MLSIAGCTKEQRKDEFIARVNDAYLTREEFASLVDTSKINDIQKKQVIETWIYDELLFQEAKKEGILNREDYKKIVKNSERKLAASIFLKDFSDAEKIDYPDGDLFGYYEKNKNYFKANSNTYLINRVYFSDEDIAIKFRHFALENDWEKTINLFINDSSLKKNTQLELVEENKIYPIKLSRMINDLYPQEISIVITEKPEYYSIVQMIEKYSKDSFLPFEAIKNLVRERYVSEKKIKLIEEHLKEIVFPK